MRTVGEAALRENFARVKAVVDCVTLAEEETEMRFVGALWRGKCPLIDHEDNTPSFYCYPNEAGFFGSWWCFGCGRGGDVFDLCGGMFDHASRPVWAMRELARRFGVPLAKDEDLMSEVQLAAKRARKRAHKAFADAVCYAHFEREILPQIAREVEGEEERGKLAEECLRAAGLLR